MRLVDGCWYWARVVVGIGGLLGVRVFGWNGVGNLGIGKVDVILDARPKAGGFGNWKG